MDGVDGNGDGNNHFPFVKIWFILQLINQAFSFNGWPSGFRSQIGWRSSKLSDSRSTSRPWFCEEFCKDGWWFFYPLLGGVNSNICYVLTLIWGRWFMIRSNFDIRIFFKIGWWKTTRFHQPCRLEGNHNKREKPLDQMVDVSGQVWSRPNCQLVTPNGGFSKGISFPKKSP